MKNIFKILIAIFVIGSLAFMYSCEDDEKGFYDGPELVSFTDGTAASYYVLENNDGGWDVQVGFTTKSNTARTVNFTISGDATEGQQFNLASSSITVPAGETVGTLTVNGIYAGFTGQVDTLIITLTGDDVAQFDNTYTLVMQRYCPFIADDFVGTWDALDDDGSEYQVSITHIDGDTLGVSSIWDMGGTQKIVMIWDDPTDFHVEIPDQFVTDWGAPYGTIWVKQAGYSPFSACDRKITLVHDMYFHETTYWFGGHYFVTELTFNSAKTENKDNKTIDSFVERISIE